ncbi:MAG: hypothetical protein ACAI25_18240 [Planctomycetota bacterium]
MSDLPKGYLRCPRCTATFPGQTDEGKPVERCPGCQFDVDQFRPRTARMMLRAVDPFALTGRKFGVVEIVAIAVMVLSFGGLVAFLVLRRSP